MGRPSSNEMNNLNSFSNDLNSIQINKTLSLLSKWVKLYCFCRVLLTAIVVLVLNLFARSISDWISNTHTHTFISAGIKLYPQICATFRHNIRRKHTSVLTCKHANHTNGIMLLPSKNIEKKNKKVKKERKKVNDRRKLIYNGLIINKRWETNLYYYTNLL